MDRFHQPSSIRILDTEYRSVGTGIYVGERLILTCEHVVAEAQGRSRLPARPDQPVRFVFAYADGSPGAAKPEAKLLRRWPDAEVKTQGKVYDVALLEITDPDVIPTVRQLPRFPKMPTNRASKAMCSVSPRSLAAASRSSMDCRAPTGWFRSTGAGARRQLPEVTAAHRSGTPRPSRSWAW
jgi:hypothetical protein